MTTPTHRAVLYLLAYLRDAGERGWREGTIDPRHAPDRGCVVLLNGAERMEWALKFNSGNPHWFCTGAPKRLRGSDAMPVPFRNGGS